MKNTLILYSSVDGQTQKICQVIAEDIKATATHTQTQVMPLSEFAKQPNLADFDAIIVGASIRYGKHRKSVYQFIEQHKPQLSQMQTGFFSVNLVARKPEKNTADTSPYITKFLQQTNWQPTIVDVFAGKLDYSLYGFFDRLMIRFIMWITKGVTRSDKPIEYTDWQRVKTFTKHIAQLTEQTVNVTEQQN